jgi:peptidoglycan-associated lipoprotein
VDGRVNQVEASARRLIYEVTLSEDEGDFTFGDATLPDEAKARLDQMVTQLKADPKGVFIEVEGHTDNVGQAAYNEQLGLERAETVKRYLYAQHQLPLHKINVISYGEDKPVAPNNTRAGRAQNRRVVVRILS